MRISRRAALAGPAALLLARPDASSAASFAWRESAPGDAGFAPDIAARLDKLVADKRAWGLHGVVVARKGALVLERYFEGEDEAWGSPLGRVAFGPDTLHDLRSVTKSILGDPRGARCRAGEPVVMMRALLVSVFVAIAQPALAQISCTAPQQPMLDIELMLGRGKASEARWRQFLKLEVTPRFPDGLTVYETTGQWRDPRTATIGRERSRVLRIIAAPDGAVQDKIAAVAEAYKKQFRQKSVGVLTREICAAF